MNISATLWRDGNHNPIQTEGVTTYTSKTFTGSNTTVNTPIFRITGSVEIRALYGVITTVLGSNHTAAAFRLNDQVAVVYITAVGGTTLSGLAAGTTIVKKDVVSAALAKLDNVAGVVSEPTTLETSYFSPFVVVKKTGAQTDIEYRYATTNEPTTGAMQFFVRWIPLSSDGDILAV